MARCPTAGLSWAKKKIRENTMIVIDVGAHYLGYSSDICRSFFIDPVRADIRFPSPTWLRRRGLLSSGHAGHYGLREEKLKVWRIVLEAQSAATAALKPNNTAADVDIAARTVIEDAGYGEFFTHRVGHGIGFKAHESPYLDQWNRKTRLQPGMVFTNEPGIYILGKFGVRHEDVYLVKNYGETELLTGRRAIDPYNP
ncbi:hypothetical protein NPX13_g11267 [Xylaria arbuscula]|uniref:Peptidase M24 domain-containing protein n=1 Tax=Xylaria arbuscula TaxID=114810 RepID=A0A9W8N385_9PEZI|nr:hypothetical protein NPX13_g11267 [Xylaria arbuscula]